MCWHSDTNFISCAMYRRCGITPHPARVPMEKSILNYDALNCSAPSGPLEIQEAFWKDRILHQNSEWWDSRWICFFVLSQIPVSKILPVLIIHRPPPCKFNYVLKFNPKIHTHGAFLTFHNVHSISRWHIWAAHCASFHLRWSKAIAHLPVSTSTLCSVIVFKWSG